MNVAILGCGFIAETHAQEIKKLGHNIKAVIDTNINTAKAFADKWSAEYAGDDFERVLADDIQVVHVCTPPMLHYEMVQKIIEADKHVICEKPLCINPNDAFYLYKKANEKGIVSAVNFNVRYHEACQRAKTAIAQNDFGRINLIHGRYLQEFHVLPADYMWRYIPELAGPMRATTEIGSHWIDLARFITGLEIDEVCAEYGKFSKTRFVRENIMYEEKVAESEEVYVDSDDAAVIMLRFSNGAIGNLVLSEVSHGRSNCVEIEVTGTKQSVWWSSEEPYKLNSASKGSGVTTKTNAFGGGFPNTFGDFFREVYADIVSEKVSERPLYPTFRDAYINSSVCDAIYESANNNGKWEKVHNI